jgi:serine/threonine protein kinase
MLQRRSAKFRRARKTATAARPCEILDFGIATAAAWTSPTFEQTTAMRLTSAGETIGTGADMSPEQVRGEELDRRSDLFLFGIARYEMPTGVHPFSGLHR